MTRLLENPGAEVAKRRKAAENSHAEERQAAFSSVVTAQRLSDVFADGGVELNPQSTKLLELFQNALDDLLAVNGSEYRRFIAYFVEKLSDITDLG
jgi:hypothetical protein